MNFISHDTAYSLYPVSTFTDRRNLIWGTPSPLERAAANQYEGKGWAVHDFLDISTVTGQPSELGSASRHIGDPMCWTFNLDSGDEGCPWSSDSEACYWSIMYSKIRVGQLLELGTFTLNHPEDFFLDVI
jgi:hypothetical protein